jgi:hypothetical protein
MAAYYKFKVSELRRLLAAIFDLTTGHNHDGTNSRAYPVPTSLTTRVFNYVIEDLSAGADISTRAIFACPVGMVATLQKAVIIPQGSAAGIDGSNTCAISLLAGTDAIVTKTYSNTVVMPNANVIGDLGSLDATHKVLVSDELLHITVTNGATANPPSLILQVTYTLANA